MCISNVEVTEEFFPDFTEYRFLWVECGRKRSVTNECYQWCTGKYQ